MLKLSQIRPFPVAVGCAFIVGLATAGLAALQSGHYTNFAASWWVGVLCLALIGFAVAADSHMRKGQIQGAREIELLQDQLRETENRFRVAQKLEAVGQLAGGIAHDFNNLMTVIGCSVDLLSECIATGDPKHDDLSQIKAAADRAAVLTSQLLAFSRRRHFHARAINVNEVILDLEQMLRRVLGSNILVQTNLLHTIDQIFTDQSQIEQIIMNLAVNARDAMPSGGSLLISTQSKLLGAPAPSRFGTIPAGKYVTISVKDSGIGMSPFVLEHAFEPFFTTKESGKGTGLGLATIHGIVHQCSGHIIIETAPNEGTTFTLYFPKISEEQLLINHDIRKS